MRKDIFIGQSQCSIFLTDNDSDFDPFVYSSLQV